MYVVLELDTAVHTRAVQMNQTFPNSPKMENFLEGLASLTQDIRHLVNGTLVRHPQQQEERLIITTANDNTRLRDVADSETAAYFQRWAKSVLEDTERLVSTHKRQQRMNRLKSSGAKQSVNMLLDEEMLIEMDSYLSSRQVITVIITLLY